MRAIRGLRYCPPCSRLVLPKRRFAWGWFLAWTILGLGAGGLVYLLWYAVKPRRRCSLCRGPTVKRVPKGLAPSPTAPGRFVPWEWAEPRPDGRLPGGVAPRDPRVVHAHACPSCKTPVVPGHARPVKVTCPACGASGTLCRIEPSSHHRTRPALR